MTLLTVALTGWTVHLLSAWLPILPATWICYRRARAGDWWGFTGAYAGLLLAGFGLPLVLELLWRF